MRKTLISINNALSRLRRVRVDAENILVLTPHCLQNSKCKKHIIQDPDNCGRCGRCAFDALLAMRDELGFQLEVVAGGRKAVALTRRPEIKLVIAVACEKELTAGILGTFPKPVIAVPNRQPNGPCCDTEVDVEQVRRAVLAAVRK